MTAGPNKQYTDNEIEVGLTALAMSGGHSVRAAELLEAQGNPISQHTLRGWKRNKAERYERIKREIAPRLKEIIAQQSEELALSYYDAERHALALLYNRLDKGEDIPTRDLSSTLRNLSVSRGIAIDKTKQLREERVELPAIEEAEVIIAKWHRKGYVIDSTATEEPAASLQPTGQTDA